MRKVTWRRFDQSAKQLVVGQTTICILWVILTRHDTLKKSSKVTEMGHLVAPRYNYIHFGTQYLLAKVAIWILKGYAKSPKGYFKIFSVKKLLVPLSCTGQINNIQYERTVPRTGFSLPIVPYIFWIRQCIVSAVFVQHEISLNFSGRDCLHRRDDSVCKLSAALLRFFWVEALEHLLQLMCRAVVNFGFNINPTWSNQCRIQPTHRHNNGPYIIKYEYTDNAFKTSAPYKCGVTD